MKKSCKWLLLFTLTMLFAMDIITGVAAEADDVMEEATLWVGASEEIDEAPGFEDPRASERKWAVSIGLSSGFAPDYEGSNDYGFGIGPNISASWRDTIFYKGKTLGANLIRQKNLKAGLILAKSSGRDEDDNDKLEGLGDVDGSFEAGGFVSYRGKPWRFRAEARQDIDSGHEGALVELSGGATLPFEKPTVFLELGTTWASDDYMDSFFGIDARQSADSGLKRIGGLVEYKRLVGDAADSPIVDDKDQFLGGLSLSYHMGSKFLPEDLK